MTVSKPFPDACPTRETHVLDASIDRARVLHRPNTEDGLRRAAFDLQRQGLTAHDIGQALQLSETAVEQLLSEPTP
jgi:hypothetical protein